MNESINEKLQRAYDLIEAERQGEARLILEDLLKSQQDNPDVWWLYAHAVEDAAPAENALNRVKQLDPNYPGTSELIEAIVTQRSTQSVDTSLDNLDVETLVTEDVDGSNTQYDSTDQGISDDSKADSQRILLIAIPIVLVLLLVIVFGVINPFGEDQDVNEDIAPTSTVSAQAQTTVIPTLSIAVNTPVIEETAQIDTEAQLESAEAALREVGLEPLDGETTIELTQIGETLLVPVCSEPGQALRDALPLAMTALATVRTDIQALGVRFINCRTDESIINTLAVDAETAYSFADDAITLDEFRAQWRPIG